MSCQCETFISKCNTLLFVFFSEYADIIKYRMKFLRELSLFIFLTLSRVCVSNHLDLAELNIVQYNVQILDTPVSDSDNIAAADDVGEEEARLPLGQRDTILPRENDFR